MLRCQLNKMHYVLDLAHFNMRDVWYNLISTARLSDLLPTIMQNFPLADNVKPPK